MHKPKKGLQLRQMKEHQLGRFFVAATVLAGCTLGVDQDSASRDPRLDSLSQTITLRSPDGRSTFQAGGYNFIIEGNGTVVGVMLQSNQGGDWQYFGPTCDVSASDSVVNIVNGLGGPSDTRGIRCEGSGPGQPVDVTLCSGHACDTLR